MTFSPSKVFSAFMEIRALMMGGVLLVGIYELRISACVQCGAQDGVLKNLAFTTKKSLNIFNF